MTTLDAAAVSRRLSIAQREVLRDMAEGRVPTVGNIMTMRVLIRLGLVVTVDRVLKVTGPGQDVVRDMPRQGQDRARPIPEEQPR